MDDAFSEQVEAALQTRPVIEQAKGVLVALRGATPEQAFAELSHVSQRHNVKLQRLAAALTRAASGRPIPDLESEDAVLSAWGSLLCRYPHPVTFAGSSPPRLLASRPLPEQGGASSAGTERNQR